ncbi:MAG: hypothetical protein AAF634_13175 [Bacteroidota bacterium]
MNIWLALGGGVAAWLLFTSFSTKEKASVNESSASSGGSNAELDIVGLRGQLSGPPINPGSQTPDRLKLTLYNQTGTDFDPANNASLSISKIHIFDTNQNVLGTKAVNFKNIVLKHNSVRTLGVFPSRPEVRNVWELFVNEGKTHKDFKLVLEGTYNGQTFIA